MIYEEKLIGLSLAFSNKESYYLSIDTSDLLELFRALEQVEILSGYDIKTSLTYLQDRGYNVNDKQQLEDYIVAARLCSTERYPDLTLSYQLIEHLGYGSVDHESLLTKDIINNNILLEEREKSKICSLVDLSKSFDKIIEQTNQIKIWNQEKKITKLLLKMENIGIRYDIDYRNLQLPRLRSYISDLKRQIWDIAGKEFNINSNAQLTEVMNDLGIRSSSVSDLTGNSSWNNESLSKIDDEIAIKIINVKKVEKVVKYYFEDMNNDIINCQFKNWSTVTGRLSCVNPNLQNIYKSSIVDADNLEISIRRLFKSRKNYRLYMFDYEQMEMRIFADYVNDSGLNRLFKDIDFDMHSYVANRLWHVNEQSSDWEKYRNLAKKINFGVIYGIGVRKLARQLSMTLSEAKKYKQEFFLRFPKVKDFIELVDTVINRRGWIFNRFKRRYWIDPNRSYVGVNYLVQGTGADIVKDRMIACDEFLKESSCRSKLLLQVHDELIFEVHESEEEFVPFKLKEIMEEKKIETYLPVKMSRGCFSWAQESKWIDKKQVWEDELYQRLEID